MSAIFPPVPENAPIVEHGVRLVLDKGIDRLKVIAAAVPPSEREHFDGALVRIAHRLFARGAVDLGCKVLELRCMRVDNVLAALDEANLASYRAMQSGNPIDVVTAQVAAHRLHSASHLEQVKERLRARGIVFDEGDLFQ